MGTLSSSDTRVAGGREACVWVGAPVRAPAAAEALSEPYICIILSTDGCRVRFVAAGRSLYETYDMKCDIDTFGTKMDMQANTTRVEKMIYESIRCQSGIISSKK